MTPAPGTTRRFRQVDVFGTDGLPLSGNPLAVVVDAEGLTDAELAAFARWTNLSETTFLLPPTTDRADYRVRIFTPGEELPFAGHPTLGSAAAWLATDDSRARGLVEVVQECGLGLVRVRVRGEVLAFAAPPRSRPGPLAPETLELVCRALGIGRADVLGHQWCVNGPVFAVVRLGSAAQVLALRPDDAELARLAREGGFEIGVVGDYPPGGAEADKAYDADKGDEAYEVRAFVPGLGLSEDPVTGSLNAAIAQWRRSAGEVPARYAVGQGKAIGRAGRMEVEDDGTDIWIGGRVRTVIAGTVDL